MTRQERGILWDYYIRGMTQAQVAEKRGVKLWRVRQMTQHKDAWTALWRVRAAGSMGGLRRWSMAPPRSER